MKRTFALLCLLGTVALGGCAQQYADFKAKVAQVTQVFELATTTTVPANVVIPAAYAFDAVKAAATNYGEYCIHENMAPAICSSDVRRVVVKSMRSGTAARNALKASIANNTPALATAYNAMVQAMDALKAQPIAQAPAVPK